jgi:lipopolysaccharide export LptBFGC system permease protein LptF
MIEDATAGERTRPATEDEPHGSSLRRFLVPALIAGLVIALTLTGTFVFLWLQSVDTSPEEVGNYIADEAPVVADVALEVATLLSNYDATNIEERREQIVDLSVGRFRQQYEDLLSQGLGAALEETAASSRGQILNGPDVSFVSGSEASAIIETTQTVQSNDNPTGRTYRYVMQLTLIDTPDGGWKVNEFLILSQQET